MTLNNYSWNEKNYWIQYLGTWNLDKAHIKDNLDKKPALGTLKSTGSPLRTSLVHQIISEELQESTGQLTAIADVMHPDFLAAVNGHMMNGCGVATSVSPFRYTYHGSNADLFKSIWADMTLTIGQYLYKRMVPGTKEVHMNVKGWLEQYC